MEFKKIFVLFAVFLAVSGLALAIRGATIDSATDLTRWTGATSTASDVTEGGNITAVNLNGSSLTDRWAGYFGNISGANIYLTDASGGTTNYLYTWAVAGANQTGEVCVSTFDTFDFATIGVADGADIDTAWGFAGGADLGVSTFNSGATCNLSFEEQGSSVSNTNTADGDSGLSSFETCVIDDGAAVAAPNDLAFCTNINSTGVNYLGTANTEYEIIVAANDSLAATTTYYFFIEIG